MGWIDTKKAGEIADLNPRYIAALCKEGVIKGQQWGRSWMVDEDSVRDYASAKHKPGPKGPIKPKGEASA
jgi:hypothetical protein